MAEQEVSAKGISAVASVVHKEVVKSHSRGLTPTRPPKVDRKGKGKAVDDYEKAGSSRIKEVVEPAPSGIDKATVATPPTHTVDEDTSMGFSLGLFAPDAAPPKSILKGRASDTDITSSASKA